MPAVIHQAPAAGSCITGRINKHPAAVTVNIAVFIGIYAVDQSCPVFGEIDPAYTECDFFAAEPAGGSELGLIIDVSSLLMIGLALTVKIMPHVLFGLEPSVFGIGICSGRSQIIVPAHAVDLVPAFFFDFGGSQFFQLFFGKLFSSCFRLRGSRVLGHRFRGLFRFRNLFRRNCRLFRRGRFRGGFFGHAFGSGFTRLLFLFLFLLFQVCHRIGRYVRITDHRLFLHRIPRRFLRGLCGSGGIRYVCLCCHDPPGSRDGSGGGNHFRP